MQMDFRLDEDNWLENVLHLLKLPAVADYSLHQSQFKDQYFQEDSSNSGLHNLLLDIPSILQPVSVSDGNSDSWQPCEQKQIFVAMIPTPSASSSLKMKRKDISMKPHFTFSELDMVEWLMRKKLYVGNIQDLHPAITETDVYAYHPADLVGTGTNYFITFSKYSNHKKPRRLRMITKFGYRWKQQGRVFTIRNRSGETVALKTYLSYVALQNTRKIIGSSSDPNCIIENSSACSSGSKRWAVYTMEEVTLVQDYSYEKNLIAKGIKPRPFPVFCQILSKYNKNFCDHHHHQPAAPSPDLTKTLVPPNPPPNFRDVSRLQQKTDMCVQPMIGYSLPLLESQDTCSAATSHEGESAHDSEMSAIFRDLEALDETMLNSKLKAMIAELPYLEGTMLL